MLVGSIIDDEPGTTGNRERGAVDGGPGDGAGNSGAGRLGLVFWEVGGKTVDGKGLGLPEELVADRLGARTGDGSLDIELVASSVGQSL